MSTNLKHDPSSNSDSEDDEDYVPPDKPDSESEQSDTEDENGAVGVGSEAIEDEETKKRKREALWSSFQASVASASKPRQEDIVTQRLVKIERRFRFAGKDVVEIVEVPEDSPEATEWPLWKNTDQEEHNTPTILDTLALTPTQSIESNSKATDTPESVDTSVTEVPSTPSNSTTPPALPTENKPALKRPGPRKPKTSFAPLPGSSKPKKLTTLDKSAMDWKTHLQTQQEAGTSITDELEANRRAGGYLEKVEFLKRVEERKDDNLESLKSNKRRKI